MTELSTMVVLTGAELDAVAAGARTNPVAAAVGNLVGVAAAIGVAVDEVNVDVLNNNRITIGDVLSDNVVTVGVGVAVAALGGAAGVINRF